MGDDGPIGWIRSLSDATRIFPLRPYPHPTTVGRHEDCDIILSPQSISRHHASIQIAEQAASNSNAVAILRDSSFNGCFVGDDLVRNRAEWLAAGDVVRFGNDKEKFVVETISMNEGNGNRSSDGRASDNENMTEQHPNGNFVLSPIDESNQHGGIIAGIGTEHGERMLRKSGGSISGSPKRYHNTTQPMQPMQHTQQRQAYNGRNVGDVSWKNMQPPPMPMAPAAADEMGSEREVDVRSGQSWQIKFPTANGVKVNQNGLDGGDGDVSRRQHHQHAVIQASNNQASNGEVLSDGRLHANENHYQQSLDEPYIRPMSLQIYGGTTLGGGNDSGVRMSSPKHSFNNNSDNNKPMSASMPSFRPQQADAPTHLDGVTAQKRAISMEAPSTAWDDVRSRDGEELRNRNMQAAFGEVQHRGENDMNAMNSANFLGTPHDSLDFERGTAAPLNAPPPMPSGDELFNRSHALTVAERRAIHEEKNAAAKHMRDLNMLLAGTLNAKEVEFVFTDPGESQLEGSEHGGMERNQSTGSLQSRKGRERIAKDAEARERSEQLKFEHDRALVGRSLSILEKHKTRGLQKAMNKWKLEVRAINMSRVEKDKVKRLEEEQRKKDEEMEDRLRREECERKQRSAIQLMLDAKKKGKQLMTLAGWNSWKQFIQEKRRDQFSELLREKDSRNGITRIAKVISSGKTRSLFKAMSKWRQYVFQEVKRGGQEEGRRRGRLMERCSEYEKRAMEAETRCGRLSDELESLKVTDWARALSDQQKVVGSLRRQLRRVERGWASESASFAASVLDMHQYVPQESVAGEGTKSREVEVGGGGIRGVLQQRKIRQMGRTAKPNALKEQTMPAALKKNGKVRQIQTYIVGKARELARIGRECEEWKRRAQTSGRNWSILAQERDELVRDLEVCKDSGVRQSAQLLDMVRERDERIVRLQQSLVSLAGKQGSSAEKSASEGGTDEIVGVLKKGGRDITGDRDRERQTKVKILSKRRQAAAFLAKEFEAMQKESTARAQVSRETFILFSKPLLTQIYIFPYYV